MNPKADFYFKKSKLWSVELLELRSILISTGLQESIKWGVPTYLQGDAKIVLIHEFKEYCALLFFKGVLLKDSKHLLIQQTKNVQAARQLRFTNITQIQILESVIQKYIKEAIEIEVSGQKVELKSTNEFELVDELRNKFDEMPELKVAFDMLSPGKQRGYLLYFSGAKQAKTRKERIEKSIQKIFKGEGMVMGKR